MVPKYGMTLDEVNFSIGSVKVVGQLRAIGALRGKKSGQTLLFPSAHVAEVAAEYFAGKYDEQIGKI